MLETLVLKLMICSFEYLSKYLCHTSFLGEFLVIADQSREKVEDIRTTSVVRYH